MAHGSLRECTPLGHHEWERGGRAQPAPCQELSSRLGCARSPLPRCWWAHIALPDGHCRQEQQQRMGPALVYTASLMRAAPAFLETMLFLQNGSPDKSFPHPSPWRASGGTHRGAAWGSEGQLTAHVSWVSGCFTQVQLQPVQGRRAGKESTSATNLKDETEL